MVLATGQAGTAATLEASPFVNAGGPVPAGAAVTAEGLSAFPIPAARVVAAGLPASAPPTGQFLAMNAPGYGVEGWAAVHIAAASDSAPTSPPTAFGNQALLQLNDTERTQLLAEMLDRPRDVPTALADGSDGLSQDSTATAVGPDDLNQLFNAGWSNGLDG